MFGEIDLRGSLVKLCLLCVVVVVGMLASDTPAQAATIVDGDFLPGTWQYGSYAFDRGGGTATVTPEYAGGNPGARLNITTHTPGGTDAAGMAIRMNYSTTAALEGQSYTFKVDARQGPGSYGAGQGIDFLVEQSGNVYRFKPSGFFTWNPAAWTTVGYSYSFYERDFHLLSGSGADNPEFHGGVVTHFGFSGWNGSSGNLTQYYDNFSIASPALVVPVPSSLVAMSSLGAIGLAVVIRRRRRTVE